MKKKDILLEKKIHNRLLRESYSTNIHNAIDVISMLSDYVSFGSAGLLIDVFHSLLYFVEYSIEVDDEEKDILLMQAGITLGSALLPGAFQVVSPYLKKIVRLLKEGKDLAKHIDPKILKQIDGFMDDLLVKLNQLISSLRNWKGLDKLGNDISDFQRILSKRYKGKKLNRMVRYYTYLDIISRFISKNEYFDGKIAERINKNYIISKTVNKAIINIGKMIDEYSYKLHKKIAKTYGKEFFNTIKDNIKLGVKGLGSNSSKSDSYEKNKTDDKTTDTTTTSSNSTDSNKENYIKTQLDHIIKGN